MKKVKICAARIFSLQLCKGLSGDCKRRKYARFTYFPTKYAKVCAARILVALIYVKNRYLQCVMGEKLLALIATNDCTGRNFVAQKKAQKSQQSFKAVPHVGCAGNQQCMKTSEPKACDIEKGLLLHGQLSSSLLKRVCVEENQGESYKNDCCKVQRTFYGDGVKSQDKTKFNNLYLG